MNLKIIQIEPLPDLFGGTPLVDRPPNTKEFNYSSIAIEVDGEYYYWSRGVNLEISKTTYKQITANAKLFVGSVAYQLHEKVNQVLGARVNG